MATWSPKGGEGRQPKRRVPPFNRDHEVSDAKARRLREAYIKRYEGKKGELRPAAYGRDIFDIILKQKGCVGMRFYPGADADGNVTLLFCGVDKEGNDILAGTIGDVPFLCPPYCSSPNGILHF